MLNKEEIQELYQQRIAKFRNKHAMLDAHPDWLRANEFHHYMSLYYVSHYLNISKKMTVLDYGCGIGRLSIPLAPYVRTMYACDINPSLIELAMQSTNNNIAFHTLRHNTDLNFIPDQSLDCVFTYGVFCHLEDDEVKDVVKSFLQKLKPDGRILLFELTENGINTYHSEILIRRTVNHWKRVFQSDEFQLSRHKRLMRMPSYARHVWNKYSFLPHFALPLLRLLETLTLYRKPHYIEYSIDLFELKAK